MFNAIHILLWVAVAGSVLAYGGLLLALRWPAPPRVVQYAAVGLLALGAVQYALACWAIWFVVN